MPSHLAKRLKEEGHYVRAVDWKENEYMKEETFCNEFLNLDLRFPENCKKACEGMEWCFNLAADMGGMGFIQSNHSRILYNSTMISFNVAEAARVANVKRFWYASSACIYPEGKQLSENLDGPNGTWKGGREKAPAAFCRKAITSTKEFEMWGNGLQTRSFCYIDDCVEGILRLMVSDYKKPLNIGSDEMVSMNEMAELVLGFKGEKLPIKHIPGPEGVRGRNSDNTLIKQVLGWAPSTTLKEGLKYTFDWIKVQVDDYIAE